MKHLRGFAVATIFVAALPPFALANPVEVENGVIPTGGAVTLTPAGGSGRAAQFALETTYNPTGIVIGSYLYFYAQEVAAFQDYGACPTNPTLGDAIIAWRIALNANGDPLDSQGNPALPQRIGRISPCLPIPVSETSTSCMQLILQTASFGPGQVLQAGTKTINGSPQAAYHLLADVSNQACFFEVWHGWTADGVNWTWETDNPMQVVETFAFGAGSRTITDEASNCASSTDSGCLPAPFLSVQAGSPRGFLLNPVLLSSDPATGAAQWWGYLKFYSNGIASTGMKVDWNGSSPTTSVLTGAPPNCAYETVPNGMMSLAMYQRLCQALPNRNIKSLLYDRTAGGFQAWSDELLPNIWNVNVSCTGGTTCNQSPAAVCPANSNDTAMTCSPMVPGCLVPVVMPPPPPPNSNPCNYSQAPGSGGCVSAQTGVGNPFFFNTVGGGPNASGSTLAWWLVSPSSISTENAVFSSVRPMPSGYGNARTWPFRWNSASGKRYLLSTTNDANICIFYLQQEVWGEQVVESTVSLQQEAGLNYYTVTPCRVIDTRSTSPLRDTNPSLSISVAGACGIPSTAVAVAVNATAVNATAPVDIRLYPADVPFAPTSNVVSANTSSATRAGNAQVRLGAGVNPQGVNEHGVLNVVASFSGAGQVDFVLDVSGYFQ